MRHIIGYCCFWAFLAALFRICNYRVLLPCFTSAFTAQATLPFYCSAYLCCPVQGLPPSWPIMWMPHDASSSYDSYLPPADCICSYSWSTWRIILKSIVGCLARSWVGVGLHLACREHLHLSIAEACYFWKDEVQQGPCHFLARPSHVQ